MTLLLLRQQEEACELRPGILADSWEMKRSLPMCEVVDTVTHPVTWSSQTCTTEVFSGNGIVLSFHFQSLSSIKWKLWRFKDFSQLSSQMQPSE